MKRITIVLLISLVCALAASAQSTKILMKTSLGDMTIMLYDDTPFHKENFEKLVKENFYDGIIFHRVIKEFMIQAGNPNTRNHKAGERYADASHGETIPAEFRTNHYHKKGVLSAARLGGPTNPEKESSGSQFYIVQGKKWTESVLSQINQTRKKPFTEEEIKIYKELGGYPPLDFEYTVFGEVIKGLDVIDKIAAVRTLPGDRPATDVVIISARIIK